MFGAQKNGNVVDEVIQLRQQGVTDNQIVQELQQKGFSTQQIFEAMSQADLGRMSQTPQQQPQFQQQQQQWPEQQQPDLPPAPFDGGDEQYASPLPSVSSDVEERINEVAEAIISERWNELTGDIQKIVAWKESVESDVQKLKDELEALRANLTEVRQGVFGKINEYDSHMRDVSSELQAVHKVFKDVIPSFTENVAELSRVTKQIKKK